MLGAAGAHVIQDNDTAKSVFETALRYHMWHVFAILGVTCLRINYQSKTIFFDVCGLLLLCGTVLFSGSLYLKAFVGTIPIPWITPIGGLLLIAGWLTLAIAGWVVSREDRETYM